MCVYVCVQHARTAAIINMRTATMEEQKEGLMDADFDDTGSPLLKALNTSPPPSTPPHPPFHQTLNPNPPD